ncbi:MAG TPA: ATP-binding protein [Candidatus Acidoferrales bacterium]|nr:ATP-binding protein [Candidatus Acidoferrales bacterium]
MGRFSIRVILSLWFTVMLALIVCALAVAMYFAMRHTIVSAADANLSGRLEEIGPFIEGRLHSRHAHELAHEFKAHLSGLRPGGDLLQVRSNGKWLYRSASIAPYRLALAPAVRLGRPQFATIPVPGTLLRTLSANVRVEDTLYTVELAEPIGEYYAMLGRFRALALWFLPALLVLSWVVGYRLCRRALAPVDEIASLAREISARNLNLRLAVPRTGDELARLSETLNGMIARLEKAFNRISEFTADAAHELRTPIALILTTAELALRQAPPSADQREALEEIRAEAVRTKQLIEDLMTLARADSANVDSPSTSVDLAEVLRLACERSEPLAGSKQIEFTTGAPAKSLRVEGDPDALRRLLAIIIDNAVKYTPSYGRVSVSLSESNSDAVCEIADTGIGIAAEDAPHIFERFYRADRARSRDTGGAGLGLSIAHSIASAHGGMIEFKSTPGAGSVFRVRIPIAKIRVGADRRHNTANGVQHQV